MKLISKERIGSKIIKKYDKPKTPFKRILEIGPIENDVKERLKDTYKGLNPFELKRKIDKLQDKVFRMSYLKKEEMDFMKKKSVEFFDVYGIISSCFFMSQFVYLTFTFLLGYNVLNVKSTS